MLGIEELALQPKRLEIVGNLGIFKSPLSATIMLGGRHENIFPAQMELSQACMMMRRAAAPVAQKSFRLIHVRQLSHKEIHQPEKNGVRRVDKIEKHQVYSPPGQGSPKLISNMTAPSLEVPRKISQTCTVMRRTAAPIAQRSFHTTQMASQQEEIKEDSIPESYSNCRNSTTGTVEGRTISKQDPREALSSSSRKTNTDQDKKYEEHQPQHAIEQNPAMKDNWGTGKSHIREA